MQHLAPAAWPMWSASAQFAAALEHAPVWLFWHSHVVAPQAIPVGPKPFAPNLNPSFLRTMLSSGTLKGPHGCTQLLSRQSVSMSQVLVFGGEAHTPWSTRPSPPPPLSPSGQTTLTVTGTLKGNGDGRN